MGSGSRALDADQVSMHARIKVRMEDGKLANTTPGRILVWRGLPAGIKFRERQQRIDQKNIAKLVDSAYRDAGVRRASSCDRIKAIGYEYATRSGISIGVKDMLIPDSRSALMPLPPATSKASTATVSSPVRKNTTCQGRRRLTRPR